MLGAPPVKRIPRVRRRLPERKRPMTLVAGFVLSEGILLCADTLYSDGTTKAYKDKLFGWFGKYTNVCFAISGSDVVARMVVEECMAALFAADDEVDELRAAEILD